MGTRLQIHGLDKHVGLRITNLELALNGYDMIVFDRVYGREYVCIR
jgi:hypothetical protein